MSEQRKLTKTQKQFLERFHKTMLAECLSELYGYEEAFSDCTISEVISIIMEEIEHRGRV